MSTTALLIVLFSCFLHAWWNFVLKRSGASQTFVGLSKCSEAVIFLFPFLYFFRLGGMSAGRFLFLITAGAIVTGANYVLLSQAYKIGDLSFIYPLSRAGILLFLPIIAIICRISGVSALGVFAVVLILLGMTLLVRSQRARTDRPKHHSKLEVFLSLAAAFTAACSTLWDRYSVRQIQPLLYFYGYTSFIALGWLPSLLRSRDLVAAEWRSHKFQIVQVGVLNVITYCLILFAIRDSNPTYVVGLRQLSVALGAMLGWWLLKEPRTLGSQLGVAVLTFGCALTAFA